MCLCVSPYTTGTDCLLCCYQSPRLHSRCTRAGSPISLRPATSRIPPQETAISAQFVPGKRFLELDFGVYAVSGADLRVLECEAWYRDETSLCRDERSVLGARAVLRFAPDQY
eukprot:1709151-Rhodomonas_salina.2